MFEAVDEASDKRSILRSGGFCVDSCKCNNLVASSPSPKSCADSLRSCGLLGLIEGDSLPPVEAAERTGALEEGRDLDWEVEPPKEPSREYPRDKERAFL